MVREFQITSKIKRAEEHGKNLEAEIRRFLDTNPYKVAAKRDPQSRKLVYYVSSVEPTPDCLPLIAGDAIQNLMSALDHLAFQLVLMDTGDNPPNLRGIYFPIADDAAKYEAIKRRKVEGARQETLDALDALKPYKGGNGLLWILWRLNNIEKHRLLLTVGSQAAGLHLGQLMAGYLSETFPPGAKTAFESMNIFLMPADTGFPLKAGFQLYTGAVDEEPNPKQQFRFDVALSEPGIVEGKPLLDTIHQMMHLVENIVSNFSSRLK